MGTLTAMRIFTYRQGAELPFLTLPWKAETAEGVYTDIDMSLGTTFELTLTRADDSTVALTKTTGLVGLTNGVRVEWAAGELEIPTGDHHLKLRATDSDRDRDYRPADPLQITIVA